MHAAEYYSALKKVNSTVRNKMDELGGHYAKYNKPVTEGKIEHDSTYVRYLKQASSKKQSVDWWLSGAGERERWGVAVQRMYVFSYAK